MAAAAALLISSVMKVPTKQITASTTSGLVPHIPNNPSANFCAIPVFSMAIPKQTEPAKTISTFQLMLLRACSMLQQRVSIMANAARKQAFSSGITWNADRSIMASIIPDDTSVL